MFFSSSSRPEIYRRAAEAQGANSLTRFPSKPFPHSMLLVFNKYDYKTGFGETGGGGTFANLLTTELNRGRRSGVSLRNSTSIELPFPKQLQDSTTMMINGFSRDPLVEQLTNYVTGMMNGNSSGLGTIGDIPQALQRAGANFATALSTGSGVGGALNSLAEAAGSLGIADAAVMGQYLLRKFIPGDLGRSVNLATGQILNPRETLSFEGVQLRSHQFQWDLYPNEANDSNIISNIINTLKSNVLPNTQDLASFDNNGNRLEAVGKAFLTYPSTVNIYLIGANEQHWMKFKPCMLTNMTVDYGAGGGVAMMKGGAPAGVNLSISLQELQIQTASDYNGGVTADAQAATQLPRVTEAEPAAGASSTPAVIQA